MGLVCPGHRSALNVCVYWFSCRNYLPLPVYSTTQIRTIPTTHLKSDNMLDSTFP